MEAVKIIISCAAWVALCAAGCVAMYAACNASSERKGAAQ